jgi:hypothetical protein
MSAAATVPLAAQVGLAVLGPILAFVGVIVGVVLGSRLTGRSARDQRRGDVHRDVFARFLAGCAAWDALTAHNVSERSPKPSDDALADAEPALQLIHLLAADVGAVAEPYLRSLRNVATITGHGAAQGSLDEFLTAELKSLDAKRVAVLAAMRSDLPV